MAPPSNLFELLDDNGNGDAAPVVKKEEPKKAPPAPAGKDGAPAAAPPAVSYPAPGFAHAGRRLARPCARRVCV